MVQAADPGEHTPESEVAFGGKGKLVETLGLTVKMELEDSLEEEYGPTNKRSKQWNAEEHTPAGDHAPYSGLLNDRSPLGLRLRKSPSLLDLIQMRLSQGPATAFPRSDCRDECEKKDRKVSSGVPDKLKASNFPAIVLKIGDWECVSRYEGDLVGKCYFAKRKLVWEVLNGGLKSKIEIQWSDIAAIKATFPDSGPDTLDIVVSRQPLFFRETNPQPRKHTLWQATSDFTGGQASRHRQHFLQVPHGLLSKHFEKLLACDAQLTELSRQPTIILDSPFFDPKSSSVDDEADKAHDLHHIKIEYGSPSFSALQEAASSDTVEFVKSQHLLSQDNPSTSSEMGESRAVEENTSCVTGELTEGGKQLGNFKVPGIRPSMSMSDFVNHISQCMTSDDPFLEVNRDTLEEITQYLLSDSQGLPTSDEPSLMSRVNSLYCLLQKDPAGAQNLLINREGSGVEVDEEFDSASVAEKSTPPAAISRKESAGDLLFYLPRIASMPQFLFNIAEDPKNESR